MFNKLEKRGKILKVVSKGCRKEEGKQVSGFQEGSGYRKWKLDEDFFDEKKITERKRKVDSDSSGRNQEKKGEGVEEVQDYRKEMEGG